MQPFNINNRYIYKIDYRVNEVVSDDGFIYEHFLYQYFQSFEKKEAVLRPGNNLDNFFYSLKISGGYEYTTYDRKYIKVQDLVAAVGGFMSLIQSVAEFIFSFYQENHYYIAMIDKIFNLHFALHENESPNQKLEIAHIDKEKDPNDSNKSISPMVELENFDIKDEKQKAKIDNEMMPPANIIGQNADLNVNKTHIERKKLRHYGGPLKKHISNIINEKKKKSESIKIGKFERCKFYICCYETKIKDLNNINVWRYELMKEAESTLDKKSDILYLFKTYDQFSLIKKILLNENNLFMLENREKQNIFHTFLSEDSVQQIRDINTAKQDLKKMKLEKYLKEANEKQSFTQVDKLLYQYLDESLRIENLNMN